MGIGGREVTAEYPFLADVHVWRRHVEMEHKESPLLAMTLQHRTKVGVTVQYSTSHLMEQPVLSMASSLVTTIHSHSGSDYPNTLLGQKKKRWGKKIHNFKKKKKKKKKK